MIIDQDLVMHIAELARVELSEAEVHLFSRQLQDILRYIEKLKEVNESVEPFSFDQFLPTLTRPDLSVPSLPVEEALQNAPERVRQFFKVPRIIP